MSFANYLQRFDEILNAVDESAVTRLIALIEEAYRAGKCVYIIGNGGSGANASHLCEDLGKGTLMDFVNQKRLKVQSLTDNVPYILAWGNDTSFDGVFEQQLRNLADSGDVLIAISGSGNSPNVLRAIEYANAIGMKTYGVTGYDGGKLLGMAHDSLHVKSMDMGIVEGVHSVVFHFVTDTLKERFAQ